MIDSGWNCTPSTGSVLVAHAHDLVLPRLRGDLERQSGTTRARSRASGSASRIERVRQPGEQALPVVEDLRGLAVHDRARRARSCRRTPGRCTGGRGRRRGSGSAGEHASITSIEMPASFGVHGPGEITMRARRSSRDLVDGDRVVALDAHVRAELAEVLREVVGERVVVVDQEELHGALPCAVRAIATARSTARALLTRLLVLGSGTESATRPAPACT